MSSPLQMTELYDNALLGILQHVENIQDFLKICFGFLYRKTDFYCLMNGPHDKMGFPPGVAEKIVLKTFKLFEKLSARNQERAMKLAEEARAVPAVVEEIEVQTQPEIAGPAEPAQESMSTEASSTEPVPVGAALVDGNEANVQPSESEQPAAASAASASGASAASAASASGASAASASGASAASASGASAASAFGAPAPTSFSDAESASAQVTYQENPDSYNGAVRDNYSWSQDYYDVEVRVFVPPNIVKGRQVSVSLQSGSVRVAVKEGASENILMGGEFTHKINMENSLWSLEPGRCVLLSLNKSGEVWWTAVLKGEQQIDINQINRERSMATVDEEERAVLNRLTFDYQQKLHGKPQSHEMKVHEMLKKGWDAEGSPFKGQQFDPSMFNIASSSAQF